MPKIRAKIQGSKKKNFSKSRQTSGSELDLVRASPTEKSFTTTDSDGEYVSKEEMFWSWKNPYRREPKKSKEPTLPVPCKYNPSQWHLVNRSDLT